MSTAIEDPIEKALNYKFSSDAGDDLTVRQWLVDLSRQVWTHGEEFSGKRPWGNSGWEYSLYNALVVGGFVKGTLDEDGYVEDLDESVADAFVEILLQRIEGVAL